MTAEVLAKARRVEIRPFVGPVENIPLQYNELCELKLKDSTANLDPL